MTKPKNTSGCKVPGCDKEFYAKGFCNVHYNRNRLGTSLERPLGKAERIYQIGYTNGKPCSFEGCKNVARSFGLCSTHYQQMKKYGWDGMRPANNWSLLHKDENGRNCRTCKEYKPWSEYYLRSRPLSGGQPGYQTECRECQKIRQKRNWEKKYGRKRAYKARARRT